MVEIREGNLDQDSRKEAAIFSENAVLIADWRATDHDLGLRQYPAPDGTIITDGQILDGKVFIATKDKGSSDFQFDFYQRENLLWRPVLSESLTEHVLRHLPDLTSSFSPQIFLVGDWDGDGEYEVLSSDGKTSVYANEGMGFVYADSPVEWEGDYQFANPAPWESKDKKVISVPNVEAQEQHNQDSSKDPVVILQSPAPNRKELNLGEAKPVSMINRSGRVITDFQVLPYRQLLPERAQQVEGSMDWVGFWKEKYPNINPWVISTMNNTVVLMDADKYFRTPETYNLDFDFKEFHDWLTSAQVLAVVQEEGF